MPELPEAEITRLGITPFVAGRRIVAVVVRNRRLRWPVPRALAAELPGQTIHTVRRRAKYLLLQADTGTVLIHLGMSGSLRVLPSRTPPGPYDHVELVFTGGQSLRLRDPRRFGCVLWTRRRDPLRHRLLAKLGPEPLTEKLTGDYLYRASRRRNTPVKSFLMDARTVAGLGNIYASEALYRAGIHPNRAAGRVGRTRYHTLAAAIKTTLREAIQAGGTTLRDFRDSDGHAGYFAFALNAYGRAGEPCPHCRTPIRRSVIGQRASYYCPHCQT